MAFPVVGVLLTTSLVLGSWKCRQCSHLSRYNKMTVSSGTINGLIFYASILSFSGLLDYHACTLHPVIRVPLSWINLDFGIEACFYSGMDVYQKSWLQ